MITLMLRKIRSFDYEKVQKQKKKRNLYTRDSLPNFFLLKDGNHIFVIESIRKF